MTDKRHSANRHIPSRWRGQYIRPLSKHVLHPGPILTTLPAGFASQESRGSTRETLSFSLPLDPEPSHR